MKIDFWKVFSFFALVLFIAARIYPSHLEMAGLFEKSRMYDKALTELNFAIETKHDINAITQGAKIHEIMGNIDDAESFYNKVLIAKPMDMDAHTNLIRLYQWTRQPDKCIHEYTRYLKRLELEKTPEFSQTQYKKQIYINLKNIYSEKGDWNNFINTAEKLLRIDPNKPEYYNELINVYLADKNLNRIICLIKSGLHKFPNDIELLQKSAFISFLLKRYDISLDNCRKLVALKPDNKEFWFKLINVSFAAKNKEEICSILPKIKTKFGLDPEFLIPIASFFVSWNNFKGAEDIYTEMMAKYPKNSEIIKGFAICCEKQKNYKEALALYHRLKKINPDNINIDEKIIELYFASNDIKNAEKAIEKLLQQYPGDPNILHMLAQTYETTSRPKKAAEIYEKLITTDPDNLLLQKKLADCYSWAQNYEKAIIYLNKLIAIYPEDIKYKEDIFYALINTNQPDKAEIIGEQLIKSNPNNDKYKLDLAYIYIQKKNFDLAYSMLKDITTKNPKNIDALESFAWCCESTGKKQEALVIYEKLISIAEPKEEWIVQLITLYMDAGNTQKAMQFFDKFLTKFPRNQRIRQLLADALIDKKQYDQALKLLNELLTSVPNAEKDKILFKICSVLIARNEFIKAEKIFLELYKNNPNDPEVIKSLAEIYWVLNNFKESIRFYNYYVKIKPQDYNAHYALSSLYEMTGDKPASLRHAGIAIDNLGKIPQTESLAKIYARIYQKLSKLSQSMAYYNNALKNDPDDIDLFRDYIGFLASCGYYNTIIDKIESAPQNFKEDQQLQRYLAQSYTESGDYDKAVMIYSQLLDKNPTDADLKSDLAFVFQKKGRWDKSLLLYEDILKSKDPSWERYKEIKKEVKNLKKIYGFNIKTGYTLIDEIKKDTQIIYSHSQIYLAHNLLARAGFSRYFLHDSNPSVLGNINETISESTIEFEYFLNQFLSANIGPFMINHGPDDIYTFNAGLTFNNKKDLMLKANYTWNDKEIDPRGSVKLGGKTDNLTLQMNWDVNPAIKIVAEAIHSEHKFGESARRYGLPTYGGYSNQFVAGADLNIFHDPRIALTYRYFWKDSKIDQELNDILSYKSKIRSHQFGILYEHYISEKISFYGTAFVGTDSERDMFLKNMGMYGLETGTRIDITDNFEIGAMYQFNYENGLTSGPGRINYLNIYSVLYF